MSRTTKKTEPLSGEIAIRPANDGDWPVIEKLFGPNGACGGCWCMWPRLERGGKLWEENKGSKNRRAFRKLVTSGAVHGCLAFADGEPVGWCCVGPRIDFPRLARVKALATDWDEGTWSVVCFYIKAGWRRRGVATVLLKGAVALAKERGAKTLEAYPVRPSGSSPDIPAAFAWTGVAELFRCAKFTDVTPKGNAREIYARRFRKSR